MKKPHWQTTASVYVVDSPFLRLRKDSVKLPNGTLINDYFVREGRAFCTIFAITVDGRVVLIRQYRHGIGRVVLELPSGIIDGNERPRECALRELAEETGYVSQHIEHLTTLSVDPSNATTEMHLYLVRDARLSGRQRLEATEDIDVQLATPAEVVSFVRNGTIDAMGQVAAIHFALDHLRRHET